MAAVERATTDTSTLWAATTTGRVFISDNADADPASAVTFVRLDSLVDHDPDPLRDRALLDPDNANHAWISYSGFNAATPATPGHLFSVTYNPADGTATWTSLDGSLGDMPLTDVATTRLGDLYVSTDFGVFKRSGNEPGRRGSGHAPRGSRRPDLRAGRWPRAPRGSDRLRRVARARSLGNSPSSSTARPAISSRGSPTGGPRAHTAGMKRIVLFGPRPAGAPARRGGGGAQARARARHHDEAVRREGTHFRRGETVRVITQLHGEARPDGQGPRERAPFPRGSSGLKATFCSG